jgi:nuclear pore complex protein Nup85
MFCAHFIAQIVTFCVYFIPQIELPTVFISGDAVLPQLMEWIKFHFFHHERHAQAILSGDYGSSALDNGAENEPQYWNTVIGLVLQGRLDGARALLKLHSASLSEPFKAVDCVMRTMPLYNVSLNWSTSYQI